MFKHILITRTVLAFCLTVVLSSVLHAQSEVSKQGERVEPSYDVTLDLLIGSTESSSKVGVELPASLATISKQLRANFAFTNYRLVGKFVGRISNNGTFDYRSVINLFGKDSDATSPTFLEWSLTNFRNMPVANGQAGFQAQAFRFGARVPVVVGNSATNKGASIAPINYENIGLTLGKIGFAENRPTLIGTLSLPSANDMIFLVMTVRATD